MMKFRIVALLLLLEIHAWAQRNHFIAIQSENKQPFYAKLAANVLNSTPSGHLIIPKLADSTYIITIGIPKNNALTEQFSITVTKDVGFMLRNDKQKGLFLSNSQTAKIIQPVRQSEPALKDTSGTGAKKDDGFSRLMAQVVNDSAVMENMIVAEEPRKEEPKKDQPGKETAKIETPANTPASGDSSVAFIKKKETDSLRKIPVVAKTSAKKQKVTPPKIQRSIVKMISEQRTDSSMELVYQDLIKDDVKDTVQIVILLDSGLAANKTALMPSGDAENNKKEITGAASGKKVPLHDSSGIASQQKAIPPGDTIRGKSDEKAAAGSSSGTNINNPNSSLPKDSSLTDTTRKQASETKPLFRPMTLNTNCRNEATDYDVDRLRVKILAIEDEDDKISAAKKVFKTKCFYTNQIGALGELFPTDAGKYKLFDAAYPYVADLNNFTSLQSFLKDAYYINRFKAMIR
jgi:hypothetical protein